MNDEHGKKIVVGGLVRFCLMYLYEALNVMDVVTTFSKLQQFRNPSNFDLLSKTLRLLQDTVVKESRNLKIKSKEMHGERRPKELYVISLCSNFNRWFRHPS